MTEPKPDMFQNAGQNVATRPAQSRSAKKGDEWIDDLVGALTDPIIVYPSGWQDTLPDWIKPQITLERIIMNIRVSKEGGVPVGDTEALAYIYPRTMESPMNEQWVRIYMYVFNQAMKLKKTEVPEDLKSEKLSDYDMEHLNELKGWIYQRRVKHRKEKARAELREGLQAKEGAEAEELETSPAQPSFF
ncbi:hypothetical protein LCGC14_1929390 [marine sediment metagenome]|uniref:Uncharacterized protein n=1 Tax=marine sediment metagenome TaxID=412755 RepID=A0A0F9GBX6_9ZZZZ